jgi:UrcA family protein
MRKLVLTLLAAAFAGTATPALADYVTIRIDLGTLDIADPADDAAVRELIVTEVNKACKGPGAFFAGDAAVEECKADGTAKAFDELEARRALVAVN